MKVCHGCRDFFMQNAPRAVILAGLMVAACGSRHPGDMPGTVASSAQQSQKARRFIAFRQSTFLVNTLETPIHPPVTAGSTLAADLLSTSAPDVVSVDAAGNLVAHKNGAAVIRGSEGAVLHVVVNAIRRLRIVPDRIELPAGGKTQVSVVGDDKSLTSANFRWDTTNLNTAAASADTIYAGYTPGKATLTARSGTASATVTVVVRAPKEKQRSLR